MSKCTVAVTVDGWNADGDVAPTFRLGDKICGKVDVWVNEAVRCKGLDLCLRLESTQRGYSLPEPRETVRLFSGEWQPGEYEYRFELPSTMPPTRSGKLVGWKWVAAASIDIPWAIDPKGQAEFGLEPPPQWGPLVVVPPPPDNVEVGAQSESYTALIVTGLLLAGAILMMTAGFVLKALELAPDPVSGAMAGLGVVGTLLMGLMFLGARAARRGGGTSPWKSAVRLSCEVPGTGYRGDGKRLLRCEVDTKGGGAIERVGARVDVKEYVRWTTRTANSGHTTTHEYDNILSRVEVPLTGDPESGKWSGQLPLPTPGPDIPPYTLSDSQNRGLTWRVDVMSYRRGSEKPDIETRHLTAYPE